MTLMLQCVHCIWCSLFTMSPCRLIEHQLCLKLLDVSGNEGLGNQGCLELLHCCTMMAHLRLNLAACGMCSPLPNEVITNLLELLAKRRVEIVGNDILIKLITCQCSLLTKCSSCSIIQHMWYMYVCACVFYCGHLIITHTHILSGQCCQ